VRTIELQEQLDDRNRLHTRLAAHDAPDAHDRRMQRRSGSAFDVDARTRADGCARQVALGQEAPHGERLHVRHLRDGQTDEHLVTDVELDAIPARATQHHAAHRRLDGERFDVAGEPLDLELVTPDLHLDELELGRTLLGGELLAAFHERHAPLVSRTVDRQLLVIDAAHDVFRLARLADGLVELRARFRRLELLGALALGKRQQELLSLALLFIEPVAMIQQLSIELRRLEAHDDLACFHHAALGLHFGDVELPDLHERRCGERRAARCDDVAFELQRRARSSAREQDQRRERVHGCRATCVVPADGCTRTLMPGKSRPCGGSRSNTMSSVK